MTREEAIKMAKADLKCMKRDTSGQDEMCNSHKCDECSLNYERGNIGEQKEWLRLAIKALEQEPCEDAVSVTSVFEIMGNLLSIPYDFDRSIAEKDVSESMDKIRELPRVTPQETIKGHWIKEESICGWDGHSYQCSECGRSIHLDTEMEDLEDYPYCHCGAKMDKEGEE